MFKRPFIRDGDSTTSGGVVHANNNGLFLSGAKAAYEGDPVYCPSCKSMGVTRCVQPYRRHTGHDGQQINLHGDYCICRCPSPPRLISSNSSPSMDFDDLSVLQMRAASGWLAFVGHIGPSHQFDQQFLLNDAHGRPLANTAYTAQSPSGELLHGMTDGEGYTERYNTNREATLTIYLGHMGNE